MERNGTGQENSAHQGTETHGMHRMCIIYDIILAIISIVPLVLKSIHDQYIETDELA